MGAQLERGLASLRSGWHLSVVGAPFSEKKDTVATGFLLNTVCALYLCRLLADLV